MSKSPKLPVSDCTTADNKGPHVSGVVSFLDPVDAPVEPGEPGSLQLLRTLAQTAIIWPRRLGRPDAALTKAFAVQAFAYQLLKDALGNPVGVARIPCGLDLSEGPHDETHWRVTIMTSWVDPVDWSSLDPALDRQLKADFRSRTNTVEVSIASEWEMIGGLGTPFLVPTRQSYEHHKKGMITLPGFQVMRLNE